MADCAGGMRGEKCITRYAAATGWNGMGCICSVDMHVYIVHVQGRQVAYIHIPI